MFWTNQTLSAFDLMNPRSARHQRCSCIHDLQVIISWHTPGQTEQPMQNSTKTLEKWGIHNFPLANWTSQVPWYFCCDAHTAILWVTDAARVEAFRPPGCSPLLGESSVYPQLLKVLSAAPELGHRVKWQVVPFQNHASFTYENLWKPIICLSKIHRNDYNIKTSTICIQIYRETKKTIWFL